jgi:hypothetical protein
MYVAIIIGMHGVATIAGLTLGGVLIDLAALLPSKLTLVRL